MAGNRVLLLNAGHDDYARRYEDYPPLPTALYAGALTATGVPWDFLDAARGAPARLYRGADWALGQDHPWCGEGHRRGLYLYGLDTPALTQLLTTGDPQHGTSPLTAYTHVIVTTGLSWAWPATARACALVRSLAEHQHADIRILVGGPLATLNPATLQHRLIAPGLADGLIHDHHDPLGARGWGLGAGGTTNTATDWASGTLPPPDPDVAGEQALWTAAVLSSLTSARNWSTGLDQPVYAAPTNGVAGEERWRRPVPAVVAELAQRIEAGYRRFVWWDIATLDCWPWYFGQIVDACWDLPSVARIMTAHKLAWFITTAIAPADVTPDSAAVLRRARVPVVRLRLDRHHRDEREQIDLCAQALRHLRHARFHTRQVAVMVESGHPRDSARALTQAIRRCIQASLPPRLQAWAPIPGSPDWDLLTDQQAVGGGCSKWWPGLRSGPVAGPGDRRMSYGEYSRLAEYCYHARAMVRLGLQPGR